MEVAFRISVENKIRKKCLAALNNHYPQDNPIDKKVVIDICNLCITVLIEDFIAEVQKYKNPCDLLLLMKLYSFVSDAKIKHEDSHTLTQTCRYVFALIPQLKLTTEAAPVINPEKN